MLLVSKNELHYHLGMNILTALIVLIRDLPHHFREFKKSKCSAITYGHYRIKYVDFCAALRTFPTFSIIIKAGIWRFVRQITI